jgi:predicted permease
MTTQPDTARLLLSIFVSDLLPVFAIAGVGFILARYLALDARPIARMTFHALVPALVFTVLVTSTVSGGAFVQRGVFYALVALAAGVLGWIATRVLRLNRAEASAFLLVVVCSNSGNYGLPVTLLAFGRDALAFASVYFVASSIFSYTGGVLLAASGERSLADALRGVLRVPAVYGAIAAGLALAFHITLPAPVMRPLSLLSDAALPLMILVLGMQIERATWPDRPGVVAVAIGISLVATPLAAFGVAHLMGLSGPALQAGVLQSSMPTAVVTTILALEFGGAINFVTSTVCAATLLSPFTLTWIIAALQRG